jgi:dTDP-glucose 4,6-dehydratase
VLYGGAPHRVQVLDCLTYAGNTKRLASASRNSSYEFIRGSINDNDLVDRLTSETDAIIHFAAESHVDKSILDSTKFIETNILGTNVLLKAATKYKKTMVLVSTDEVYGSLANGFATENNSLHPSSAYSASKAAADLLALSFHITHGLDLRITRSANKSGKPLELYGTGGNVRNWLHITDHCEAIARVLYLGSPGEIYNVGGEESFTNTELAEILIEKISPAHGTIKYIAERLGHDHRYAVDSSKIKSQLDWLPKYTLNDSLDEIIQSIDLLD